MVVDRDFNSFGQALQGELYRFRLILSIAVHDSVGNRFPDSHIDTVRSLVGDPRATYKIRDSIGGFRNRLDAAG